MTIWTPLFLLIDGENEIVQGPSGRVGMRKKPHTQGLSRIRLGKLLFMTHEHSSASQIVITKSDNLEVEVSSGPMNRLAGVSELLTGSTGIHMAIATVPPGRCSTAHYHVNCESAIYVVSGEGVFLSGSELDKEESIVAGDFIFVPPNASHQPVNTSNTDDLVLIVARNAPVEIVVELEGAGRKDC
ncbi:cupin domain-containing protein [Dehalococcoides mccartyi]|nr:cupin domain-containing protein [Dehalococcoides mccartyi]